MKARLAGILCMLALLTALGAAHTARAGQAAAGFGLDGQAITFGGGASSGGTYLLVSSLGPGFSGSSAGEHYAVSPGFLIPGRSPGRLYLPLVKMP